MAEKGLERKNRGSAFMDSIELQWVYQDGESLEIDHDGDDRRSGGDVSLQQDFDDEDNAEQRLICIVPWIDSFDVEALEGKMGRKYLNC
ncbi:hypothetical protein ACS0TY_030440 [Phlomoides rotata]